MAVVDTKSTAITRQEAAPKQKVPAYLAGGVVREFVATVEVANGDSIASILRMVSVHSSWRVSDVELLCDAITSAAADIGLYDTFDNGAAVVDADFFASAQSIASALVIGTRVQHESAVVGVEDIEKRLWEALGLTADPGKFYDICLTLTAAATAAGTVSLKVRAVEN
jgi:hypothetical protein